MFALDLLLLCVTLTGHFAACVWMFNRMHSQHLPRTLVYLFDRGMAGGTIVVLLLYLARALAKEPFIYNGEPVVGWQWLTIAHAAFGISVCLAAIPLWIWPRMVFRPPAALVSDRFHVVDVAKRLGAPPIHGLEARILAAVPGNQCNQIAVHDKELRLANWPAALDGLAIVHLTDLHMTGELTEKFYAEAARAAAELNPDLLVISGDILEKERCLPWVETTLGKLRAPLGQFYVFGNHELRLRDIAPLEQALAASAWTNLVGKSVQLSFHGQPFTMTGNSRPWFGEMPTMPPECICGSQPADLPSPQSVPRILLAHTPDLFPWAQRNNFDLMLAGHTHGGQIRLPWIGPLISPSLYGFRYASGVFHEGPTVMHVGRGLAGEHPIRLNCAPEITRLVLRSA